MESCKRFLFSKVKKFRSLPSTQGTAKKLRRPFSAIVAHRQTKGKGRFERRWNSPAGGLYVTLTIQEPLGENFSLIPIVAAIAVREAIYSASGVSCTYKWPNDLMRHGKKVSGILVETIIGGKSLWAFIGIGININNTIPARLKSKATSLEAICRKKIDVDDVLEALLRSFPPIYERYRKGNIAKMLISYRNACQTLGTHVVVGSGTRIIRGIAKRVTDEGFLVVSTQEGEAIIADGTLVEKGSQAKMYGR